MDIFAGLMDALCRQVATDLDEIESTVDYPVEVVLGGGAVAASPWWRQAFVAALAPRRVSHVTNPEIGATGAALIAIGRFHDGGQSRTHQPDGRGPLGDSGTAGWPAVSFLCRAAVRKVDRALLPG